MYSINDVKIILGPFIHYSNTIQRVNLLTCLKLNFITLAHCEPECENGGTCLSPGICLCQRKFKGPACQYGK